MSPAFASNEQRTTNNEQRRKSSLTTISQQPVPMAPDTVPPTYLITCLYGLEAELGAEVTERFGVPTEHHWCEVVFGLPGSAARLAGLSLAGNAFLRFARFQIGHTKEALGAVAEQVRLVPLDAWLRAWAELNGAEPASQDVSVSVSRQGEHNFTYAEVQEAAIAALEAQSGRRATLDERPLELRLDVDGEWCRLLGRLSQAPLSKRAYKVRRIPAETDATIAAAMVRKSGPSRADRVLDPFCGSGTIPIERALAGPAAAITAGDIKEKVVGWAAANAQAAAAGITFGVWDALALPFADRAFTRVITAPPFGNPQGGRPWAPLEFGRLLAELLRVLEFGCPLVLLVQDEKLTSTALKRVGHARIAGGLRLDWKGRRHTIFTIERVP
jgi:tRNA (guanine6-N2)-methyltransferase